MKTNSNNQSSGGLKLNYKRTFIIGFAFFGILLLWQVYDSWAPTMLTELFKEAFNTTNERDVQYLVGIMMAIDNLAALIINESSISISFFNIKSNSSEYFIILL